MTEYLTVDDIRDAVGDHYDFAPRCPTDKLRRTWHDFPRWHDEHLIEAFDWAGITRTLNKEIARRLAP